MSTCGWCRRELEPAEVDITVLDPNWREGGTVTFCCIEHLKWYTYAVTA